LTCSRRTRDLGRTDPGDEREPEDIGQEVGRAAEEAEEVSSRARVLPPSREGDRRQDRRGCQRVGENGVQADCLAGQRVVK